MAFKMKGFSGFKYVDIFNKLKKKSGFGPRASKGDDDQSRELAKSKFEMGEYDKDPTKKSRVFKKENPDTYKYKGDNKQQKIIDLEERIGFVKSDIENEVISAMEGGKTITKLKKQVNKLRGKNKL